MDRVALVSRLREAQRGAERHTVSDLRRVVEACKDASDWALTHDQIEPYRSLAFKMSGFVKESLNKVCGKSDYDDGDIASRLQKVLGLGDFKHALYSSSEKRFLAHTNIEDVTFSFGISRSDTTALECFLSDVNQKLEFFDMLTKQIGSKASIDVLPDPDIGKMCLGVGYLIVPNKTDSPGYHVFSFKPFEAPCGERHLSFRREDGHPAKTLRQSLEYVDCKLLGTVAVVRGISKYSFSATAVPVAIKKYSALSGFDCRS